MPDRQFIAEAIRRAEELGYYPAAEQRDIDWDDVEQWAWRVQRPGFRWYPLNEQSGSGYIILGKNKAIASGQHRILGGLMGDNPVPEEAIDYLSIDLETRSWQYPMSVGK